MKKIAILMVLMMGLLALAGCSSDNESRMVDYTLTTNVTDEATGDPIEGAAVEVDGKKETTNANGLAQVDLSYGEYKVSVSADGYGNASAPVNISNSDSTLDIALSEGDDSEIALEDFVFITSDENEESDIFVDYDHENNIGNIHADAWGTGTTITPDVNYNGISSWELTTPDAWGTVLTFMGDLYDDDPDDPNDEAKIAEFPIDVNNDSVISFDVAATGDYTELKIALAGDNIPQGTEIALEDFDSSITEWQEGLSVNISDFDVDPANVNQIAIFATGGTAGESKIYITDYKISNVEVKNSDNEDTTKTPKSISGPTNLETTEGETIDLGGEDVTVTYTDDSTRTISSSELIFTSSDTDIATINGTALTAVSEGTCTITASYTENGTEVTENMALTVSPAAIVSVPAVAPTDPTSLAGNTVIYSDVSDGTNVTNLNMHGETWFGGISSSEIQIDNNNVTKYEYSGTEGESIGITFDDVLIGGLTAFKVDVYFTSGIANFQLKLVTDNGEPIKTILGSDITAGEWNTITWDLSGENFGDNLQKIGVVMADGGSAGQAVYLDNMYFEGIGEETAVEETPPSSAPTAPTFDGSEISLYSDSTGAATDVTMSWASWSTAEETTLDFSGNEVMKLPSTYIGYDLASGTDVSGSTNLKIDVWTSGHSGLKIKLVDFAGGDVEDSAYEHLAPISGTDQWVTLSIPISVWIDAGVPLTDLNQVVLTGDDADGTGATTYYIDNIYFD